MCAISLSVPPAISLEQPAVGRTAVVVAIDIDSELTDWRRLSSPLLVSVKAKPLLLTPIWPEPWIVLSTLVRVKLPEASSIRLVVKLDIVTVPPPVRLTSPLILRSVLLPRAEPPQQRGLVGPLRGRALGGW